jgi:glycine betaine/proline transport system ATP-binding protein
MMRTKRIAMVFQKFALMPWLTVRENISFGLEMQGRPEKERRKLVDEKLELVGLTQWRNKKPDELRAACSNGSAWRGRWRWTPISC